MPVLRGTVTYARFRALSAKAWGKDPRRSLAAALRRAAFEPLAREGEEDRSCGWVELHANDSTELAPSSFLFGDYFLVSWRVDAIRIPTGVLKSELAAWAEAFEAEQGRPPKRGEKSTQKGLILKRLRKQAFIASKTYDVSWNLSTETVQIWASSRKMVDEIIVALEEGFGAKFQALSPGALAEAAGADMELLAPTDALFGADIAAEARRHG